MHTAEIYWHSFLNWQSLLDILIIAAGIFFLYRTLLRLGTWKILAGILLAFGLFVIASVLGLEGVEWIFKNVSHVALLALIIVFQPEIRKILEKVVSLTVAKGRKAGNQSTETIAESLWELAGQKRGAIIVFPGNEQIQDKISGGYSLNAMPSKPLIMSIFDPNSPGHDGAVIVEADTLKRFGVRLPMSSSSRLDSEYGTRHHAAMGMAEQTDSLVLLVSEERGHISSFLAGKMKRLNSPEEIVREIEEYYAGFGLRQMTQQVSFSRRTSLQVVASLLIAGIFWSTLIVGEKQMVERTVSVPVEYTSPGEGLAFIGNRTNELIVHAAGPKSAMDDFVFSSPRAIVDLSQMQAGDQRILVSKENIKHPKELSLQDIIPSELEITLVNMVRKAVPVTPQLIGQLPASLKLASIEVFPKEIEVLGPPARLENRSNVISTTPIYLNSIDGSARIVCKIIAPASIQPLDKRWPDVEVILNVERKQQ